MSQSLRQDTPATQLDSNSRARSKIVTVALGLAGLGALLFAVPLLDRAAYHMANWGGGSSGWDITVNDTYQVTLERQIIDGQPMRNDVNTDIEALEAHKGSTHPLTSGVRMMTYPLSWQALEPGAATVDVRKWFEGKPQARTNSFGELSVSGSQEGYGTSLYSNDYVPARQGATFVVGDGLRADGGYTFYEIQIARGRMWSQADLVEYRCDASALYATCKPTLLPKSVDVAAVPVYGPFARPDQQGDGTQQSGTQMSSYPSPVGTLVRATVVLPPQ